MIIEISGAGFINKGAQLMLITVIQKISSLLPGVEFCVNPHAGSYRERSSMNLHQLFPAIAYPEYNRVPYYYAAGKFIDRLIPKRLVELYGAVRFQDPDVLLDISGYSIGGGWPWQVSRNMALLTQFYHDQGKPVVFLPQAFGPFPEPEHIKYFKKIVRTSDLLYARDQQSYAFAQEHHNHGDGKIHLAPDMTIFCKPSQHVRDSNAMLHSCAAIVPNVRILDKGSAKLGSRYVELLANVAKRFIHHGLTPYILIHEAGRMDYELGCKIAEAAGLGEGTVVRSDDPLVLKSMLGSCSLVVGSRFHALVSALSMLTPSIALGWSHKYEQLMQDFGVSDFLFRDDEPEEQLIEMIDRALDDGESTRIRNNIREKLCGMQTVNDDMWEHVSTLIQERLT